jgi:DNA repair protein RecN (Recombination protein N)
MLQSLYIQNIALIEKLEVSFGRGLNCLTGETGAGKSVIVDSIGFVLGARSSRDLIRTGAAGCKVVSTFYQSSDSIRNQLSDFGINVEEDGTLIISRELTAEGKNSCRINGQSVTLTMLRRLGEMLLDIHGQHDNQTLMKPETHIHLLDDYGESRISALLEKYGRQLQEYNCLREELLQGDMDPKMRSERIDLLTYQINEIEAAGIQEGEKAQLKNRRDQLAAGEKITGALCQCAQALNGDEIGGLGAASLLSVALKAITSVAPYDDRYEELRKQLQESVYTVEDISREISSLCEDFYFTPEELTATENRLEEIEKLTKKYGEDIESYLENARRELDRLADSEAYVRKLQERISAAYGALKKTALELSGVRREIAEELSGKICGELDSLEMHGAAFCVDIQTAIPEIDGEKWPVWGAKGADRVEFMISANAGEPPKPVAKIASGGELSRIMLAIKSILAASDMTPTLVFDEIDIGISGKTASSVAGKLRQIALLHQVICVTHSVQIAMRGNTNIYLSKQESEGRTLISCKILDYQGKIREIARLLDGDPDSEMAIQHAKALLEKA